MNIQPLNNSMLASIGGLPQRQQPASPDATTVPASQAIGTTASQQTSPDATQNAQSAPEQLKAAVKAANDFVSLVNNSLEFNVDKDTGMTVVKVIDKNTNDVIRQIPSEEMLAIAKALDTVKGLLLQQKA